MEGYTLVCDAETNSLHVYDVTRHVCGTIVKNMQSPKGIVLHKDDLYILSMQQPEPIGALMSYRHPQQVLQPIVRGGLMGGSLMLGMGGHPYAATYCLLKYSI